MLCSPFVKRPREVELARLSLENLKEAVVVACEDQAGEPWLAA
jgi:hypothetical protein